MTVDEAIRFLRQHGLRVRWTANGALAPTEVCALIVALAKRPRGLA